ncbi:MAG: succinylglutamate desuccinylase/aspartoacylase family protein [Lachnospiraceae bacterium]|nr:succinylglutamate desuccinylase/aspartoacylase family protein [Lachnospiraceae bacterium]
MIQTVARAGLPVDELQEIRKMRIEPLRGGNGKRISIVTGIHGDELEGQYVCYRLSGYLKEHRECLRGMVDIYPALNPFGIDSITRGIPAFDLDMNRIFPGNTEGDMNEYLAAEIIRDIEGSDLVLDIHASNIFLTEVPQIRINELHQDRLVPYAKEANVDFIWVHGASTVLESTFAHSLNIRNTPTLVVEMGVGMRITKEYGEQLFAGIIHLMKLLDIWDGEDYPVRRPVISSGYDDVCFLNASSSGIFLKNRNHGAMLKKDDLIGTIVNPLSGEVIDEIKSPADGWLFTIREYPVVSEGSLMGRVLRKEVYDTGKGEEADHGKKDTV